MVQEPLAARYTELNPLAAADRINAARARLGKKVVILGHHYQRDEIIAHADTTGDSYKLAKVAAALPEAEFIIFCGVHFMAESADILTADHQKVILPNLTAGCSMADMAGIFQVRNAWKQLEAVLGPDINTLVPITYINSAANLKAFVGERGGTVCTSSNAPAAVEWALQKASKVLFFPDQHLGRNTGVKLGFDPQKDMVLWDPMLPLGGNSEVEVRQAKFLLWKGHCSVHKRFTVDQIEEARVKYRGIQVIVHPECPLETVRAADLNGSTEYIIKQVEASPSGSAWAIGTEINLVNRLATQHPDKTIFCLDPQVCPCSTMYRIHPSYLLWVLDNLQDGRLVNQVSVKEPTKSLAKLALDRMIAIAK